MIIPLRRRPFLLAIAACAALWGAFVALRYHDLGLTLAHYDARGHLVVARRIFDSITPGWQQIGAVWLPLPHLLNAIPVQVDMFYRTGASAVAISIASFAMATASVAWIVVALTDSTWAAIAGAAVLGLNPNVLYLQSTPMTEPLLLALTLVAIASLIEWCMAALKGCATGHSAGDARGDRVTADIGGGSAGLEAWPWHVGVAFALACMTRYEAWPVTAVALAVAAWIVWRGGAPARDAVRNVARIASFPIATILAFLIFSRIVVGEWFVATGFFVPENRAQGDVYASIAEIMWGLRALSGRGVLGVAIAGALAAGVLAVARSWRSTLALPLVLVAAAVLPALAFYDGHPYRIRYMIPLIAAEAVLAGIAAGLVAQPFRAARFGKRLQLTSAAALLAIAVFELRPLDASAPMVAEAQWDRPNVAVRQRVTDCLKAGYRGETIMASMGSLGHYMQELSRSGFSVRDFLHEGNGDIWLSAIVEPRAFAGWLLIEEKAEGGDALAVIAREHPRFLEGFSRVCEGAGVALYRRDSGSKPDVEGGDVIPAAQIDLRP